MLRLLGVLLGLGLGVAQAAAPSSSERPQVRGAADDAPKTARIVRVTASELAPARSERPRARNATKRIVVKRETSIEPRRVAQTVAAKPSLRPKPRPKVTIRRVPAGEVKQAGLFKKRKQKASAKGSVCGVNEIKGAKIAPIRGRIRGCGIADPVAVTSVAGVALSTPAKIDCGTAKALNYWVKNSVQPTVGRLGGGVASLKVAAHYACRTRNNKRGAKISEHGKGRAIDISAINLKNGQRITVLKGWRRPVEGKILKKIHRGACGPFGTVLGPNADRYHQDHFHFDTARYRSGTYCR